MLRKNMVVAILIAIVAVVFAGCSHYQTNPFGLPDEVYQLVNDYWNAVDTDPEMAVEYLHFEDPTFRDLYLEAGKDESPHQIESAEKINDNLYGITVVMNDKNPFIGTYRAYNFTARIDGKWWYINNISHIPANLRENVDPAKYKYDDEIFMDVDDLQIIPLS